MPLFIESSARCHYYWDDYAMLTITLRHAGITPHITVVDIIATLLLRWHYFIRHYIEKNMLSLITLIIFHYADDIIIAIIRLFYIILLIYTCCHIFMREKVPRHYIITLTLYTPPFSLSPCRHYISSSSRHYYYVITFHYIHITPYFRRSHYDADEATLLLSSIESHAFHIMLTFSFHTYVFIRHYVWEEDIIAFPLIICYIIWRRCCYADTLRCWYYYYYYRLLRAILIRFSLVEDIRQSAIATLRLLIFTIDAFSSPSLVVAFDYVIYFDGDAFPPWHSHYYA